MFQKTVALLQQSTVDQKFVFGYNTILITNKGNFMSYTFAGTSVTKGALKVRFANSDARAKQLAKLGDTDVNIVPLPHVMDKTAAVAYLLDSDFAKDILVRAVLEAEVAPKAKAVRTVNVRVKSIKPKAKVKVKVDRTAATEAEVDALYAAVYGKE
jgi:hypothetical protein